MKISLTLLLFMNIQIVFSQVNSCDNSNFLCNKNGITVTGLTLCEESHPGMVDSSCVPERAQAYGKWFKWIINANGSLKFNITPLNSNDDIDFAVYRSDSPDCENMNMERCMASGINYSLPFEENFPCMGTCGLRVEDSDIKEELGCLTSSNNYLSPLACITGEVYYLLVQNITDTSGFSINFSGDATFISSLEEFESLPVSRDFTMENFDTDNYCDYSLLSQVKSPLSKNLEVFPNPTNQILSWRLNASTRITNISIIDLQGKVVSSKIDPTSSSVNVSTLSAGTYILRIQSEDGYGYKIWVKM